MLYFWRILRRFLSIIYVTHLHHTTMNWKNGCVAILKNQDEPIGTGFVVFSTGIIVTCSHLLRPQPDGTILIRFTANNETAHATVIEEWSRGREEEDVAFLRLTEPLPSGIPALPLATAESMTCHGVVPEIRMLSKRTNFCAMPLPLLLESLKESRG